jgi:hypothetical protein
LPEAQERNRVAMRALDWKAIGRDERNTILTVLDAQMTR